MKLDLKETKLLIDRYIFIIKVRFNLKREYFTLGVPILLAILFLLGTMLAGHTFPEIWGGGNNSSSGGATDKMTAYQQLLADMADQENGTSSTSTENITRAGTLPEEKKSNDDMDQMLVVAFVIATLPYSIDVLMQKRRLKKQEVAFSQLLYKLSELMRGGIDPIKGIISISRGELGAIKKEVQDCASSLVLGHSLEYAMDRLNAAIGSKLVSKYIDIIVQAAHTGGNVSDLVFRTSEDMRAVISLERDKESNLKQYAIVFYLAQGIMIMLVYILSTSLLPMVQTMGQGMGNMGGGMSSMGGLTIGSQGLSDINFKLGFFHMIILNALLGGMIIGMITEGDLKQGLKHANFLLVGSYLTCLVFILPVPPVPTYNITVVSGGDQVLDVGERVTEPIVLNITDNTAGAPAKMVYVKISSSPLGVGVTSGNTDNNGQYTVNPSIPKQKGVYLIKATVGRSFNSTTLTVGTPGEIGNAGEAGSPATTGTPDTSG